MPSPEVATTNSEESSSIRLGLKANWQQFGLLVLVNAFVGGMVGLERTILPLIAETTFGGVTHGDSLLSYQLRLNQSLRQSVSGPLV